MKRTIAVLAFAAFAALGGCGQKSASISDEIDKQEAADQAVNARANAENEAYLAKNKARPGVITTASGLQYEVLRKGNDKLPSPGLNDQVAVMYEGKLVSGKVFDSSYARGEPTTFAVGGVIPGWTEALLLMHPGDMYNLVIPPSIGYGFEDKGDIPPNSVLVFKVELLGYQRAADGKVVKAQ